MSSSNLNLNFTIKELLAGAEKLSTKDLEKFFENLLHIRAKRRAPHIQNREAELLEKINHPLTADMQSRFDELRQKQEENRLSEKEQKELFTLIDFIEKKEAERVLHIGELAEIRKVSVAEVLSSLGIQLPFDA